MRYVILGAGGIGATIGGRLFEQGHDVVLVARGAHLDALQDRGLELRSPGGTVVLPVPAVGDAVELGLGSGDVVILATKTQDSVRAMAPLAQAAADVTIVCAQNGVQNERMALRRFQDVHGMCVFMPTSHLEPGVVECYGAPRHGILDVGRYPSGVDGTDERLAEDLHLAGFFASARPEIMRRKYGKLVSNLSNVLEASAPADRWGDIADRARAEAIACYDVAGIQADLEDDPRRPEMRLTPIDGRRRGGGSTWQSIARGTGSTEADYLNGEIVLLGRIHGVPTPVNEGLQALARRLVADRTAPGSLSAADLADALPA